MDNNLWDVNLLIGERREVEEHFFLVEDTEVARKSVSNAKAPWQQGSPHVLYFFIPE
jgi:hypothetical protein